MILQETYKLENGTKIPKLGLGTWCIDNDKAAQTVRTAVTLGYHLIDTAQAYKNEQGVGEGIRSCSVPREELFVASKVAAELKTYEAAAASIEETLEKMGLDYLDQMIIHAPQPWNEFRDTKRYFAENKAVWRALEDAQATGKVRVIGVSNFLQDDLENLLSDCRIQPMVNQILLHISNTDHNLLNFCREQHIQVEAYSPIAHGEALKNPVIAQMAKKYGVPLVVRSSLNNSEGTVVKEEVTVERMLISGVALDTDAVRIAVIGLKDSPGVAFKLFDTLAKKNINVDMILQSIGRAGTKDISFTVDKNDLDDAMGVLEANQARIAYSELHAEKNIAKLSIVGAGMMSNPGVAAKMFESLYNEGVNINMIATSEIRVTVLINEKDGVRAMNAVHDAFNLAD